MVGGGIFAVHGLAVTNIITHSNSNFHETDRIYTDVLAPFSNDQYSGQTIFIKPK